MVDDFFQVNRFGFPYLVSIFQAVGPGVINCGIDVQVNEITFVLKFELITNALLNFKGETFCLFLLHAT